MAAHPATRKVRARVDHSHLRKHTGSFANFVFAIREFITNALDAGACKITISFKRSGKSLDLQVLDDGRGISDAGLEALASLDFSPSAADPTMIGQNGNGSKGGFHHARGLKFETRRAGDSDLLLIEYTADELIALWNQGEASWTITQPPANHPIRTTGTLVTLLGLGVGDPSWVNPRHDRTAARLVRELGQVLPLHAPPLVTIVDEHGKSHRLTPRKLMGKRIHGEGEIPGVGSVSWEIGVLSEPNPVHDRLMVCGFHPVCEIRTFFAHITPTGALTTLLKALAPILDHPQVAGFIAIPGLKSFVGETNRGEFQQALFDNEDIIFAIVHFLHTQILPEVEANLGTEASARMKGADAETFRLELLEVLQRAGGAPTSRTPGADVDSATLKVSPTRLELEPGDQVELRITDHQPDATYRWEAGGSGGTLSAKVGTQVTYTAGTRQGDFAITLNDGTHTVRIPITIVAELPFKFGVGVRYAEPGQRITLTLENTRHTSGTFDWDDRECGGVLEVKADTLSAVYEAGEQEQEFRVTVIERDAPAGRTPKRATCTIFVRHQQPDTTPLRPATRGFIYPKQDGDWYEVRILEFTAAEMRDISCYLSPGIRGQPNMITINTAFPSMLNQPDPVRRMHALTMVAMCVAEHQLTQSGDLAGRSSGEGAALVNKRTSHILADFISGGLTT